jgi:hypothetical protein
MRNQVKRPKAHEKGNILVIAIIVTLVMTMMALPFLVKLSAQSRSSERGYRALSAFNLAEAGADRVLWEMNRPFFISGGGGVITADESGNMIFGPVAETVGDWTGHFQGTITENLAADPVTRTMTSQGIMPFIADRTVNRAVQIVLERYYKSIWDFGFFVDESFYIRQNFLVDSYDSREGAYGSDNAGTWGYFGTNGTVSGSWTIEQGSSSIIQGAIAAGTETDPDSLDDTLDIPEGTQGEFEKMILSSQFEMPSVNLFDLPAKDMFGTQGDQTFESWFTPEFKDSYLAYDDFTGLYSYQQQNMTPASGDLSTGTLKTDLTVAGGATRTLTAADSGIYTNVSVGNGGVINVTEHVVLYVTGVEGVDSTGSFYMDSGNIQIAEGGSLTVILGNTSFFVENNWTINVDADGSIGKPANCVFLGTDQFRPVSGETNTTSGNKNNPANPAVGYLNLENNGTMAVALYAPRSAMVDVQGQANLEIFGAAMTNTMDWKTNINFHYDEALGDLMTLTGGVPYWKVVSWAERYGD